MSDLNTARQLLSAATQSYNGFTGSMSGGKGGKGGKKGVKTVKPPSKVEVCKQFVTHFEPFMYLMSTATEKKTGTKPGSYRSKILSELRYKSIDQLFDDMAKDLREHVLKHIINHKYVIDNGDKGAKPVAHKGKGVKTGKGVKGIKGSTRGGGDIGTYPVMQYDGLLSSTPNPATTSPPGLDAYYTPAFVGLTNTTTNVPASSIAGVMTPANWV